MSTPCIRYSYMLILVLPFFLSACVSGTKMFTPLQLTKVKDQEKELVEPIEFPGPDPMISRERIEPINLLFMLDPAGVAGTLYARGQAQPPAREWKDLKVDEKYEWGFHAFYDPANGSDLKQRRNRIQDRLLISSDQRCGIYKRVVYQIAADSNYWTGSIATVSGVLGSLLGGNAARNLAAVSGISSGLGAEFTQAYYSNLAANVITKGIEERRKSIFGRIADAQKTNIETYTVQAAVKDAVFYDMQCSMIAGLEEAQDAIRLAATPGIDAANRIIAKQKVTAELLTADVTKVEELATKYATLESTSLLGGDRFSNIGVRTATANTGLPVFSTDYYTAIALDPAAAEKTLREQLTTLYGRVEKANIDLLKLDDSATPPQALGAIKNFAALDTSYQSAHKSCWPAQYDAYMKLRLAVDKASGTLAKELASADASAALSKMETLRQWLLVRKTLIAELRSDYLKLSPTILFDGTPDGSKKDDKGKPASVTLRSFQDIDKLDSKTKLQSRADAITKGLEGLCQ